MKKIITIESKLQIDKKIQTKKNHKTYFNFQLKKKLKKFF